MPIVTCDISISLFETAAWHAQQGSSGGEDRLDSKVVLEPVGVVASPRVTHLTYRFVHER